MLLFNNNFLFFLFIFTFTSFFDTLAKYHFVLNEMTHLRERVCLVLPSVGGVCLYRTTVLLFSLSPFPRTGVFLRLIGYFQGYYLQADSLIS